MGITHTDVNDLYEALAHASRPYQEYFDALESLNALESELNPPPITITKDNTAPLPDECLWARNRHLYPTHAYDCKCGRCNVPCECPQCRSKIKQQR